MRGAASLAGIPGDVSQLMGQGVGAARDYLIGDLTPVERDMIARAREANRILPTAGEIKNIATDLTGISLPTPQTTAGEYAHTVGEFLPASLAGPGGLGTRVLTQAVAPGLASEAAGQFTEGTAYEPWARVGGAIAGGLAASRAITPIPTSPTRRAMRDTLRNEGVEVTAGQATGSQKLRYMESEIGGNRGAAVMDRQGEQFTAAALRRAGIQADRATPVVIDNAFRRIGQQFDDLAARNTLIPDQQFAQDFGQAYRWYTGRVNAPNRAPIIQDYANEISNAMQGGTIPGPVYQSIYSRIRQDARSAGDQYIKHTLNEFADTLSDAMERTLPRTNPRDVGAWRQARREYRNLLVLEKSATGAGENAAQGIISPSQLRNATVGLSRRDYARGRGDFAALARAGEGLMKPLPNSGTPGRIAARNILSAVPTATGAMVGGQLGGMDSAFIGALAGSAVPPMVGRSLMSRPVQAYLQNQVIPQLGPRELAQREIVRSLNASIAARK
jgi:hypothetical protein